MQALRQSGPQAGNQALQMFAPPFVPRYQLQAGLQGAGQQGGRRRGKNITAGFLQQPLHQGLAASDKRTGHASGFAECGHVKNTRRCLAGMQAEMGQTTASLLTQHAKTVGIVQQQQGVVAFAQRQQGRHIGNIAIHAEDRIADNQLARCRAAFKLPRQVGQVVVRVAVNLGAGESGAINQAGVVQRIREHRVAFAHQGRHDADVGGVTGIKVKCARQTNKIGQCVLQCSVCAAVAAHQRRGAGANAVSTRAVAGGLHQCRMAGQPKVVVAAKTQHALPVDLQVSAFVGQHHRPLATQMQVVQRVEACRKFVKPRGG